MKFKEYFRISRLSLLKNKSTLRANIIGQAIGFILTLPVIALLSGVNVSLNQRLNENPYSAFYITTQVNDYRIKTEDINILYDDLNIGDKEEIINISGYNHIDTMLGMEKVECAQVYEQAEIRDTMKASISGSAYINIPYDTFNKMKYSIIDIDKSTSIFPDSYMQKYPDGMFLKGYCDNFVGDGKKQVVLSEEFVEKLGISPQDIYGKSLTIYNKEKMLINDNVERIDVEGFLCKEFKVVGIIKSEIKRAIINENSEDMMGSDLFFTSASVYDENGVGILKPSYIMQKEFATKRTGAIEYKNFENKEILNQDYMMLGWGKSLSFEYSYNSLTLSPTNIRLEANSFKNTQVMEKTLNQFYKSITNRTEFNLFSVSTTYVTSGEIFKISSIISILVLVASIIITICSVLNFFNIMRYDIKNSKYFLTMLRAIGAKETTLRRLYVFQSCIVSTKVNFCISLFGLGLSIVTKVLLDAFFNMRNILFKISMPWWTTILCWISTIIFVYLINIFLAYISSYNLSKAKIVEVLASE